MADFRQNYLAYLNYYDLKFSNMPTEERIAKLKAMPDKEIDYSDIPATTDLKGWVRSETIARKFNDIIENSDTEKITLELKTP